MSWPMTIPFPPFSGSSNGVRISWLLDDEKDTTFSSTDALDYFTFPAPGIRTLRDPLRSATKTRSSRPSRRPRPRPRAPRFRSFLVEAQPTREPPMRGRRKRTTTPFNRPICTALQGLLDWAPSRPTIRPPIPTPFMSSTKAARPEPGLSRTRSGPRTPGRAGLWMRGSRPSMPSERARSRRDDSSPDCMA